MNIPTTVHLQRCLQSLNDHEPTARSELLAYAQRRLKLLADRMFFRFQSLHSREHADDLLQEALLRLWQSLEAVGPTTVEDFMGLAALQMRRALCDLARRHYGKNRQGAGRRETLSQFVIDSSSLTMEIQSDSASREPEELMMWSEFHSATGRLPEPERTAFDLLYYHELPQGEVAEMMKVSDRQVRRYWQSARRKLFQMMEGAWPEL
jgi:RNA polymerase sigma-70 factor (ECF subfamily)